MSSAGVQPAKLPEIFTAESSPTDIKLEFTQDRSAPGIVHRVAIDAWAEQFSKIDRVPANGSGKKHKTEMEDHMKIASANSTQDPAISTKKEFRSGAGRKSKATKISVYDAAVGTSLGAIFLGYVLGYELGGSQVLGVIGSALLFTIGLVSIFFTRRGK